tara:strand:+ start:68 stop:475 length:408 start_codon:yes stop_codon:yes gene_type:complete
MIKKEYLEEFEKNAGIEPENLNSLKFTIEIPQDYLEFLKEFNGGEGDVGEEYLVLHKAEELNEINTDYEIAEFDPKIFIIGSNGSGELIAIDTRKNSPIYILIPSIFEYDAIIELASDVNGLFKRIFTEGYFGTE